MPNKETEGIWETTDMSLAAWMMSKGIKIMAIHKVCNRRNEFRFLFTDTNNQCDGLSLDFLNSDAHSFDTSIRALKKMCFGPGGLMSATASR